MSEQINTLSLGTEENKLNGNSVEAGEATKRSVYRVRDKETGVYNRVHFETSSGMIWDATYNARANMVARRDASGSIEFNKTITENLTVSKSVDGDTKFTNGITVGETLDVTELATLNGGAVIKTSLLVQAPATLEDNLIVNKNLEVKGTSELTGLLTAKSGMSITNGIINILGSEISAAGETLKLGASQTGGATAGQILIGKTSISANKTINVTGGVDASTTISGGSIIAKNGELKTTKNGLTTTLASDSINTFDINTDAATVKINKPTTVSGAIIASNGAISSDVSLGVTNFTIERKLIEGDTTPGFYTKDNSIYVEKPFRMASGTAVSTNFNADKVDGCDVNDGAITTTNLWTSSKINTQKADKSIRIIADTSNNLTGGGTLGGNVTISHGKPGAVVTTLGVPKASYMMIRRVGLDTNGHVATVETEDMSKVFASTADLDERLANSNEIVNGQFIKHSNVDAQGLPTPARNEVNNLYMKNYSIDYNAQKSCIEFTFV